MTDPRDQLASEVDQFLAAHTLQGIGVRVAAGDLYRVYGRFCATRGIQPMSGFSFSAMLDARFERVRERADETRELRSFWKGVRLIPCEEPA